MKHCKDSKTLQHSDERVLRNQRKTLLVIALSFLTMIVEIVAGTLTGSMALLADGWHMGSHVAALFLSYIVYRLARSPSFNVHFTFGSAKLFSLGGYTSAIGLSFIAVIMAYESAIRFFTPVPIDFNEALIVCMIGLVVNLASAYILRNEDHGYGHGHGHDHGHDHDHSIDHNMQSAMAHVLADALTSVTAMVALIAGKYFHLTWMDPLVGLLGSLVILKWSYTLIKNAGFELLDGELKNADSAKMKRILENDGGHVVDLHIWSVGAGKIAGIASLETSDLKGAQHYHRQLEPEFDFSHLVIEEIKKP